MWKVGRYKVYRNTFKIGFIFVIMILGCDRLTTVYLIRHSVRMPMSMIESYHTNQDKLILSEKVILNSEGEDFYGKNTCREKN